MTPAAAAAAIAQIDGDREAERQTRRAAITPHIRRPVDRSKQSRHSGTSPHNRVPLGSGASTYCGEPITTEDLDRRSVLAKKNAGRLVEWRVCSACLDAVAR